MSHLILVVRAASACSTASSLSYDYTRTLAATVLLFSACARTVPPFVFPRLTAVMTGPQ